MVGLEEYIPGMRNIAESIREGACGHISHPTYVMHLARYGQLSLCCRKAQN
jgi:hypothetical protein